MIFLRRTIAMAAAYAFALQGLLAFSVLTAHVAGATDRPAFALCAGAGLGAVDHDRLPGDKQTHCLQLCLAAAHAAGCEPGLCGRVADVAAVGIAVLAIARADAPHLAATTDAANRPRAPPA